MRELFTKYFGGIAKVVFGTLLGGFMTVSTGYINLNKTFDINYRKELYNTIRMDLYLLKKFDRELEINAASLSRQSFLPKITFKRIPNHFDKIVRNGQNTEIIGSDGKKIVINEIMSDGDIQKIKMMTDSFRWLYQDMFTTNIKYMPRTQFVVDSWHSVFYNSRLSEIDFDLVQRLNELYRLLNRINASLTSINQLINDESQFVSSVKSAQINAQCDNIKTDMNNLSQSKLVDLRKKVESEIKRLTDRLNRIDLPLT